MDKLRYRKIQMVQLIIILLNAAVAIAKLIYGNLSKSAAMTADGLHSLTDGFNNVVGMVGIYFAFRPQDNKHPYGHRKFETMATLLIGGLLIALSFNLLKGAYMRIGNPVIPMVNTDSFIVLIITVIINIFVTVYEKKKGKELQSEFLLSDATHTLSDVFISVSVIGTLAAIKSGILWADTLISVVIAGFIIKAAIGIIVKGTNVLCDAVVLEPEKISAIVCGFEGVSTCHKIRSRGQEDDMHIDLHVIARCKMELETADSMIHSIENAIKLAYPGVTDVTIHMDPPGKNICEL